MSGPRVGIVPYLNAKPLIYPLLTGEIKHDLTLVKAPPSRLAEALARRELDVALIPAVEYALGDGYRIVPDIAISSPGAVKSVLLYSKQTPPDISRVALDESSRTSAALVKILLHYRFGIRPQYCTFPPQLSRMLAEADAALLIGDQALLTPKNGYHCLDLGALWQEYTGLGFVFALFTVRPGFEAQGVIEILREAKSRGLKQRARIARAEAPNLGLSPGVCLNYLEHCIHYDLGEEQLSALERFYQMAGAEGLISKGVSFRFYH